MYRFKTFLTFFLLLLMVQEAGLVLPGISEPLIEYARETAEAKEEFVCHAERKKKVTASALLSRSHRPQIVTTTFRTGASHHPVVNRVIRHCTLLI